MPSSGRKRKRESLVEDLAGKESSRHCHLVAMVCVDVIEEASVKKEDSVDKAEDTSEVQEKPKKKKKKSIGGAAEGVKIKIGKRSPLWCARAMASCVCILLELEEEEEVEKPKKKRKKSIVEETMTDDVEITKKKKKKRSLQIDS